MVGRPRAKSGAIARKVLFAGLGACLGMALAAAPAQATIRHHHYWQAAAVGLTDPEKDAALIVDGNTGRVLYSRNADEPRHPASLTKMMTLYLLFEQLRSGQMTLATPLPVSEHAAIQAPTKLHVRPGNTVPVETAIDALVVLSANDIAVAIAEAIGGTEDNFAQMMTAKAHALGMSHTYYYNASGLPNDGQFTTASDLAILARHLAYDFPQYFHYFSTPAFTWRGETHVTHDNLLGTYEGTDGIKTGYTGASGFNLVSSVVRNGAHVVGVVMGGRTARRRDREMMRLLDDTFVSINQNPQMVARANIPWQAVADNSRTTPIIAGFQIAGSGFSPTPQTSQAQAPVRIIPAGGDPNDEDAAESRPDPDFNTAPVPVDLTAPTMKAPPSVTASAAAPAPPPPPLRTALALPPPVVMQQLRSAPPPAPPLAPATAQLVVPQPKPHTVVLAAYHPQPMPSVAPKLRESSLGRTNSGVVAPGTFAAEPVNRAWTIQIGAFGDTASAKAQLAAYAERSMDVLGQAARAVIPFQSAEGHTLYRARFGPFAEREAREVCERLTERGQTCFAALAQR